MDQLERGLLLEEGDGARIWVELRWVPCIQVRPAGACWGVGGAARVCGRVCVPSG